MTERPPTTLAAPAPQPFRALEKTRTPRGTIRISWLVLLAVIALPFVLIFVPWRQTSHAHGQATAFNPIYRPQFVVSPIEGRVKRWYVVEGQAVKFGDPIVELVDNDPNLIDRLLQEEQAIQDRFRAATGRAEQIDDAIRNLRTSASLQVGIARTVIEIDQDQLLLAEQVKIDADALALAAKQNEERVRKLVPNGASERDLELAVRDYNQAVARQAAAKKNVDARAKHVDNAKEVLKRVEADTETNISRENASKESANSEVAAASASVSQIAVRVARQRAQFISSPTDGVIFRLLANAEQGGLLVRPGERLARIVPDIKSPNHRIDPILPYAAVGGVAMATHQARLTGESHPGIVTELLIDGNDLPLVKKGDKVRIQFEGWPAIQFIAAPDYALGTFGGIVYLVDPTSDDTGKFRVLVEPDPADQPWPDQDFLRQGVRAQGWVLLDTVSLGWEAWRLLNGFPMTRPSPVKSKGAGGILGPVSR